MIDYEHFGNICANSSTYERLYEIFEMKNNISDIEQIFQRGFAIVGNLKTNKNKKLKLYAHNIDNNFIFSAKCDGIQVWNQSSYSDDINFLAWTYIDLLNSLAHNIVIRNKTLPNFHEF